jgi:hypothetical protein
MNTLSPRRPPPPPPQSLSPPPASPPPEPLPMKAPPLVQSSPVLSRSPVLSEPFDCADELPPLPPDMRKMGAMSSDARRQTKADWMVRQGIQFEDSDPGIDRAFAQARQRRTRAEAVYAGDYRLADSERQRREVERIAYQGTATVRPSSLARMKRRAESEIQTLKQGVYQRNYMYSYRARGGPSRKIQMVSMATNRKAAPLGSRTPLPAHRPPRYGHAAALDEDIGMVNW